MVAPNNAQMTMANTLSFMIPELFAISAMRYANSALPTMAQPMTKRVSPMKKAQTTFVKMHATAESNMPQMNASKEMSSSKGIANATVQAKKILNIHAVIRFS